MSADPRPIESGPRFISGVFRGLRVRIVASLLLVAGGLVFDLLYLGFFAWQYPWYASLTVILSTIIVVPVAILAMWIVWGMGVARRGYRAFGE